MAASITLSELKEYLRIPVERSDRDSELLEVLESARGVVADRTGGAVEGPLQAVCTRTGQLVLPLARLESVERLVSPTGVEVPVESVKVDHAAGIITLRWPVEGMWEVEVVVDGGQPPLRLATKIIAEHLWGIQRGTANASGELAPSATSSDRAHREYHRVGYAVPNRAAELMAPFSLALGFA